MSGRSPVTSLPSKVMRPMRRLVEPGEHVEERRLARAVGADDRDDRRCGAIANDTSLTATRPPKAFVTSLVVEHRAVLRGARMRLVGSSLMPRASIDGLVASDALGELDLAPSLGQQALGSQDHHQHQQEAEDAERQLAEVEVEPESFDGRRRALVEHVGDQPVVDERQRDRARAPRPRSMPRPPRMTIASTKIENANWNWSALTRVQVGAEERAGDAAERGADGVGERASS